MHPDHTRTAGRYDTARAEAFSDAVLAIIITLLVLDLRPPNTPPGQLLSGLLQQWPTYFAYVTSYLYVGVVWTNHKAAFRRIQWIDRGLHWANLTVLFTTALLPFATAVLSRAIQGDNVADARTAVGLYALIGALLCAAWLLFFHYLAWHPGLLKPDAEARFFRSERIRAAAGVAVYIVAGVLGWLIRPEVALGVFLAIPIFYGLTAEGLYPALSVRGARRARRQGAA